MNTFHPDLFLVDIAQSVVAIDLKTGSETKHLPLLLMTSYTSRGHHSEIPADDMIEKPCNLSLLAQKIERLTIGRREHVRSRS